MRSNKIRAFGLSFCCLWMLEICADSCRAESGPYATAARVDQILVDEIFGGTSPDDVAPITSDQIFLRRVWLDLVGSLPSPEEITLFALDTDSEKRRKMVDRLLVDPQYGQNWASYWRDVILYRRTEQRALFTSAALTNYLTEQLNANSPWDRIATEFITANGDVREKGETALIMAQFGKPEDTVSELARIFMGIQIQCAQCHDHPYDHWKREQFHELAAFFPRVAVRPKREAMQRTFLVVANDRPRVRQRRNNNNNRYRGTLEHYMPDLENPSAAGTLMQPALFSTGQQLAAGATDSERRSTLATWMTSPENEWFAKALVNRMWSELVGEGFHEPIDDLGPNREPQAPQTFEFLAEAFTQSGYDVQWLLRTIMATETYQRESRPPRKTDERPFTANRPQRLRADQLFNVLLQALEANESALGRSMPRTGRRRGRGGPRFVFNELFGYDPSDPRIEVTGSIPQALAMMNSKVIEEAIGAHRLRGGLGEWLHEIVDNGQLLTELFLRCLAREPTTAERTTCLLYVKQQDSRDEAFEDILWTLLNSAEFLHRT